MPKKIYTPSQLQAIAQDFETLRSRVLKEVHSPEGQQADQDYIEQVMQVTKITRILGRSLIYGAWDPLSYHLGISLLTIHKLLNFFHGHNILHKQYDRLRHPKIHSATFKFNCPIDESIFANEHNFFHHPHSGIIGKDTAVAPFGMRLFAQNKWFAHQSFQFFYTLPVFLYTRYSLGLFYMSGLFDLMLPKNFDSARILDPRDTRKIVEEVFKSHSKAAQYMAKELVLIPMLGGIFAPKILWGNLVSDLVADVVTGFMLFAPDVPENKVLFQKQEPPEARGARYVRQITSVSDFSLPRWVELLLGHINLHTVHHVFPTVADWRYPGLTQEVKALCGKHGIDYHEIRPLQTLKSVRTRVWQNSFPDFFRVPWFGPQAEPMEIVFEGME